MNKEQERLRQQEIILAALVSRCEDFGWKDADDVASCVQQEAYRDLQQEKQKREIKRLEQMLASAQNTYIDDDPPLFFMIFFFSIKIYMPPPFKKKISYFWGF